MTSSVVTTTIEKYVKKDDVAGNIQIREKAKNRFEVRLNRKSYLVHRVIYKLFNLDDLQSTDQIDHVDGDSTNNKISNLRKANNKINSRNRSKSSSNSSGVCGVSRSIHKDGREVWQTSWRDILGKPCNKQFSISEYGEEKAFEMACNYRAKMIEERNKQGAGYTERHGK